MDNTKIGMSERRNPEPIDTKFDVGDYIGDKTLDDKIHKDRPS